MTKAERVELLEFTLHSLVWAIALAIGVAAALMAWGLASNKPYVVLLGASVTLVAGLGGGLGRYGLQHDLNGIR